MQLPAAQHWVIDLKGSYRETRGVIKFLSVGMGNQMLTSQSLTCILSATSGNKKPDFLDQSAMGDLMGYIPYIPPGAICSQKIPWKIKYQHEELVKKARDKHGVKIFLCQELAVFSLVIVYDCHNHLPNGLRLVYQSSIYQMYISGFFHAYEYPDQYFIVNNLHFFKTKNVSNLVEKLGTDLAQSFALNPLILET